MNKKNQILDSYAIKPKYVKILKILQRILNDSKQEVLFKDELMRDIDELVNTKRVSYNNIFLIMNFLEDSIQIYNDKKATNNSLIMLSMKDLHNYFSKYFMVSRAGLVFHCLDLKSSCIAVFDLTEEVA